MNYRDVNRPLLERAVNILEKDLEQVHQQRNSALSDLLDQTEEYQQRVDLLVGLGLANRWHHKQERNPYRTVQPDESAIYGVMLSPNLSGSQRTSISTMLQRYYSRNRDMVQKVDELGLKKDEIRQSLVSLTIMTPLRQTGKSDTAVLYANKPEDEVMLKMNIDMYFGTNDGLSLTDITSAERQGLVNRRRMVAPYRRTVSSIYLLENLSRKVTSTEMLLHAADCMQRQYDQGNPDVAAQRSTLRGILRMAEPGRTFHDNLRQEPLQG